MRTNDERIAAMHARAALLEQNSRNRMVRIACVASVTVCLALVVMLACLMPGFSGALESEMAVGAMSASIFSGRSVLGHIVIAIVAFLLGTAVTIFCFRLSEWRHIHQGDHTPEAAKTLQTTEEENDTQPTQSEDAQ